MLLEETLPNGIASTSIMCFMKTNEMKSDNYITLSRVLLKFNLRVRLKGCAGVGLLQLGSTVYEQFENETMGGREDTYLVIKRLLACVKDQILENKKYGELEEKSQDSEL